MFMEDVWRRVRVGMLPSTAGSFPARPRVLGRGSVQSRVQEATAFARGPGSCL